MNIAEKLKGKHGIELYTPMCGKLYLKGVDRYGNIITKDIRDKVWIFNPDGRWNNNYWLSDECLLFPSETNRNWDTFEDYICPFVPFEAVICRQSDGVWIYNIFSHYNKSRNRFVCISGQLFKECLPVNEETVKLVGTTNAR